LAPYDPRQKDKPFASSVALAPVPFFPNRKFTTIVIFYARDANGTLAEANAANQALNFLKNIGFVVSSACL
jgi:hypothetical protein